ncbi:hypothetical protein DRO33_06290 [Candidatus Bathyarchaeota archaeon]|nr:MAG: hypothetical protein DRO33_06290 [Candidatus Bathyarchaeota archaeon]
MDMSEVVLKVGKKGEIYTSKELREKTGIRPGGLVKATIKGRKLIIEPIPGLEDLIKEAVVELTPEEAEQLSEEAQREEGVYG